MSDPRPRLAVVEGGAAEPSREAPPRTPTRRSRAVIVAWVLAVLLGIALELQPLRLRAVLSFSSPLLFKSPVKDLF